ncbi:MAG: dihydropteroate synthase [Candidatus Omnitrophota bacterium]
MRILQITDAKNIKQILKDIKVDPYGIEIMLPKAISCLVKINSISNIAANILKQEMLSLGGDVAIAKGSLTGQTKKTDCLIMGNLSQINRLIYKLHRQPFGLSNLAKELTTSINNYQKNNFNIVLGKHNFNLSKRTYIMGIINITPDSFSRDGLCKNRISEIVDYAQSLVKNGADILDIGGESTRPEAKPISIKEEIKRVVPIIKTLSKKIKIPISVDTYKPEVARSALDNGAVIINDIFGLRNAKMAKIIAKYKAGVVIMHMKGSPLTMQKNPIYNSVIEEIIEFLKTRIKFAIDIGVSENKIIIDPGIGFGKALEHNLEILKRLREFKVLGYPILVGPSRKSFIGKLLKIENPRQRIFGTAASVSLSIANGANILRVHDVKEIKQVSKICNSILD